MSPHDAEVRLWKEIEVASKSFDGDRLQLGKLFYQLRCLYSERSNLAAGRLTSGHGVFQAEIVKRGFRPNRVREWIVDYEVEAGLRSPSESTSARRKARRSRSEEYQRGYRAAIRSTHAADDPVSRFAALLPFHALRAAYCAALREFHPDHGGSEERTKELIAAWKAVETLHSSADEVAADHLSVH